MQPVRSTWAGASFRQLKEVEKMRLQGHKLAEKQNSSQWEGKEGAAVMIRSLCARQVRWPRGWTLAWAGA